MVEYRSFIFWRNNQDESILLIFKSIPHSINVNKEYFLNILRDKYSFNIVEINDILIYFINKILNLKFFITEVGEIEVNRLN